MITEPNKSNVSPPASSPQPKPVQQSATASTPQPSPSLPTLAQYVTELARLSAQADELTRSLNQARKERDQERAQRAKEQQAADALIEQQKQALAQQSLALQQSALLSDKLVFLRDGIWIRPSMVREIELSKLWQETKHEQKMNSEGKLVWELNPDGTEKERRVPAKLGPPYAPESKEWIPVMNPEVTFRWQKLTINNDERLWAKRTPEEITELIQELTASYTPKPQPESQSGGPKEPPKP